MDCRLRHLGTLVVVCTCVLVTVTCFTCVLAAPTPGPTDDGSASTSKNTDAPVPEALRGLRERWLGAMKTVGVPGLAVAVVGADGVIYQETLGIRNVEEKLPVDEDTMFYIASITKTYVATALAKLAEDGVLDLDARVKSILPRFELPNGAADDVTVRGLLCHRYGINSSPIVQLDAYTGEITEDRYWRWMREADVAGQVRYTNVHFTLAGRVIEALTGEPWRDHLAKHWFEPAGMKRTTGYADPMYADANVAFPYLREGDGWVRSGHKTNRTMHAAGGLGTSIHDAAVWIRIQLANGTLGGRRFLAPETVAEIRKTQSTSPQPAQSIGTRRGFGLGWMKGDYRGRTYFEHGGGYRGASSSFSFLPEEGIGVAVLINTSGSTLPQIVATDVYDRLLDLEPQDLLAQYEERARQQPAPVSSGFGRARSAGRGTSFDWSGTFENEDWGTVRFASVDGTPHAWLGDLTGVVEALSRGRFSVVDGTGDAMVQGRVAEADEDRTIRALTIEFNSRYRVRYDRRSSD